MDGLKHISPILLGIFLSISSPSFSANYDAINHYNEKLLAEENQCWQQFEKIGIYQDSLLAPYFKEAQRYQTNFDFPKVDLPQETLTLFYRAMSDFGINPRSISIVGSETDSPLGTRSFSLFVNKEVFLRFSAPAQLFLIAHEIQHIIYKDNSFCHFLENTVKNGKINADAPVCAYLRFTELRADIKAATFSREYAQGYVAFIQEMIASRGDTNGITHPKNSDRLNLAREILAAI
ncbi:hypothetical protein HYX58_03025 [Candidatus Dependentiae bacterium]|nr:hypothetical protein [Candidatus Dependentiae bacterium]